MDLNPRDYRAWYGLGQTYELLHMPYHALYYFRCSVGSVCCRLLQSYGRAEPLAGSRAQALHHSAEAELWL